MAWLRLQAVAAVLALVATAGVVHGFEFHEATVDAIQLGFSNGTLTSTALVRFYLDQIGRLNPLLRAVIEVNPDALLQATRLATMRKLGALVVENLDVAANFTALNVNEGIALRAEFKLSLNAYLADLLYSPVRSLAQVISFNNAHPVEERMKDFGQDNLIASQNTNGIGSLERAAIQRLKELNANGLEKLMKEHQLDAIVAPNNDASSLLAIAGHPGIVVPAGYDEQGVPFGICFGGLQGYEPRLIEMAYAFEQATKLRRPPMFKPS